MQASVSKNIIIIFLYFFICSFVYGKEAVDFQKECKVSFYPVEGKSSAEAVSSLKAMLPSRYGKGVDWQIGQVKCDPRESFECIVSRLIGKPILPKKPRSGKKS